MKAARLPGDYFIFVILYFFFFNQTLFIITCTTYSSNIKIGDEQIL